MTDRRFVGDIVIHATECVGVCGVRIILNLDVILNTPGKVLDGESRLCFGRWYKEWVVPMLLIESVQQSFLCGLREA